MLAAVLEEEKAVFSAAMAKQLRMLSDNADGELMEDDIRTLVKPKKAAKKPAKRSISNTVVSKYFKDDVPDNEVEETIAKALEMYFKMNGKD